MSYPFFSPDTHTYQVKSTDESRIIESGGVPNPPPEGLISTLPKLGDVANGFTVGFTRNRDIPHTIAIADGRSENIAIPGDYIQRMTLLGENELILLAVDEVGNWRIVGGTTR